jgi:predicted ATPase/class 3 adenylate cyclase/DNA-binding SARP family transcriptional activator
VSGDALIDAIWPANPPETAAKALHVYVSGLRRALGPRSSELLETRPLGYALALPPDALDRDRFERLLAEGRAARAAGDPGAGATLREALSLWHGPPLADFRYEPFAQAEIGRLEELRLAALEERIDADLALGRHAELVGELEGLISLHPVRERLRGQLMLALYRSGRQAEALEVYQDARRVLVEELGIDPSPPLRELEAAILRQDPALATPMPAAAPPPPPAAPEREEAADVRKVVTVVFADAASAELGELLDAEALRRVMSRYADVVSEVVARHEGTIEKFIGDTVMAVFGVPRMHEDDALRAARTALEIRDELRPLDDELERTWGARLGVRIGLNTGEVIASVGDGTTPVVTGDVVSVTGRLQRAAPAGQIWIGQATYALIKDAVIADVAESVAVAGRRSPVSAYALRGLAPQPVEPGRRTDSPLVDRVHELAVLAEAFTRIVRERACRLVTVLGPPGIGKSRLTAEFAASVGERSTVLAGRCLPYGEGITFWPVRDLLRQAAGLSGDDPSDEALAMVAALLEGEPDADAALERIGQLLGVVEDAGASEETFWAVRRTLEALARRRPVVAVFEDVHWAEPLLLDLIEYVRDWSREAPLLVGCLARPEFLEKRPGWSRRRDDAVLSLEPLTDAESADLLDRLGAAAALSPAARARIAEAAEGNPLFLEQVLAMVAERDDGVEEAFSIPPTLQALLGARLDALAREERAVLERAAVIGREFPADAVRELLPEEARPDLAQRLMALAQKDLVSAEQAGAGREPAFRFRHILIRDTAYAAVSKEARAEHHERFASWLEQKPGEYDEIIGYHLEQAFRYRSELGPVSDAERALAARAAERLEASGHRAYARSDLPATINLLERALALRANGDAERARLLPRLGLALTDAGRLSEAGQVLDEAVATARQLGDELLEAHALVERLALSLQVDTERASRDAEEVGDRIRMTFEASDDDQGLSKLWRLRGIVQWLAGHSAAADVAWGQAAEHAREAGDERARSEILSWLASSALIGPMPVRQAIQRCDAIQAEIRDDRPAEAATLYALAGLHAMTGKFDLARELAGSAHRAVEELGFVILSASFSEYEALVEVLAGDLARAEERLRSGCARLEEMGEKAYLSVVAAFLGNVLCEQGRYDEAERYVALAEEAAAPGDVSAQIAWRVGRAKILSASGLLTDAEAVARAALSLAEATDFPADHAGSLLTLGSVLRAANRTEEAVALVRKALAIYERKGDRVDVKKTRALL